MYVKMIDREHVKMMRGDSLREGGRVYVRPSHDRLLSLGYKPLEEETDSLPGGDGVLWRPYYREEPDRIVLCYAQVTGGEADA